MPVDAVYLGTALMAAQEACTAPKVKHTLVDTVGTPPWVGRGAVEGGINSGLSGLGADIHYVDNHASRTGTFLDSIAGDEGEILAQKDKIIEALNQTAKPYFGDLETMTYGAPQPTDRVMALGRDGCHEDGFGWM